jgi:CXXC-20-CXXC protein
MWDWDITCPECNEKFSQDKALDKSWVFPKKHFGCPHCETFFESNPYKLAWLSIVTLVLGNLGFQIIFIAENPSTLRIIFGSLLVGIAILSLIVARREFVIGSRILKKLETNKSEL